MTLPSLLRKVGISVPRYVTVDGQIVLESEVAGYGSGLTPLQPHRFHGGVAPERAQELANAWWNTNAAALERDKARMKSSFPEFTCLSEDGHYAYFGEMNTGRGKFEVIVLPMGDQSLPLVSVMQPKRLGRQAGKLFVKPPHLFTNGSLCIADRADWRPQYGTEVAVAWTAHWLACYTEWRMNGGIWPTDGYGNVA